MASESSPKSRRGLIVAAAALATGIALRDAGSSPVAAATSAALLIGVSNSPTNATDSTRLFNPSSTALAPRLFRVDNYSSALIAPPPNRNIAIYGSTSGSDITSNKRIGVAGLIDTNGAGIYGAATNDGAGVYGTSPGAVGVYGTATGNGGTGVIGQITDTALRGSSGIAGAAPDGNYAGFFTGTTIVNGDFFVSGAKSAAIKQADGSHRVVYCEESPESWLTDYGKAKLVGGKAEVRIPTDFAALIHSDDYHVFLTPYGDTKGLYVTNQTTTGFTVREMQGGTASLLFSYRITAKRGDIAGTRLARFTMPPAPVAPAMAADPLPKAGPPPAGEKTGA